jgi:hypothetical protein
MPMAAIPFSTGWRPGGTGIPPPFRTRFFFFSQNTTRQAFGHRTATFAEDTLVNDQQRDYWGEPTIREWAKRDIIGERLTMNVTKVIKHCGNFTVSAKYTQLGGHVLRGCRRV